MKIEFCILKLKAARRLDKVNERKRKDIKRMNEWISKKTAVCVFILCLSFDLFYFGMCHIKKWVGNVISHSFKHETLNFSNPTWSLRMREKAGKYCESITVMWHCYMQALHQCDLFVFCFVLCMCAFMCNLFNWMKMKVLGSCP